MVDLNNMEQVNKMTESCQILSDTLDLVERYIVPGPVSYTHLTLPTTPYV